MVADRLAGIQRGDARHERRGDPADRRGARARLGPAVAQAHCAAEDQALLGARHRHVHDAPLLGLVGRPALGLDRVEVERRGPRAVEPDEPQADAVAADVEVRWAEVAPAPQVGHDHDSELEALGGVDRHQPHRVEAAQVDRRVGLARLGLELGGGHVDEAAHVAPAARLVGGRHAQQLVDVGQPPRPARQGEHVQVVAGATQRALEHLVEPQARRALALAREPRAEGGQAPRVLGRQRQGVVVDGLPERHGALAGPERQQGQGVGGQAGHRRGQQPEQRLLVARVGQGGEQVAEVADLLAPPPPAAAGRQRGQPGQLERALVEAHLGRRAQQHDDLARCDALLVHQRGDALGHEPRLGLLDRAGRRQPEPQRARRVAVPGVGVGDQQLDHRLGRRSVVAPRAQVDPVLVHRPEGTVERAQDLRARAEVGGQRRGPARCLQARATRAEDLHVGMAEGVDRLQLVTDRAGVVARHQLEQLELQGVRVLELVDHDALEALAVAGGDPGLAGQQVARQQLEVVEVDAAASALGRRVGVGVAPQQLVDERQRRDGEAIGQRRGVSLAGRAVGVGGGRLQGVRGAPDLRALRVDGRAGLERAAADGERLARRVDGRPGARAGELGREGRARAVELGARGVEIGRAPRRQRRPRLPARAQLVVGGDDHPLQAIDRVAGREVERVGARRGQEVGQRGLEGLALGRAPVGGIEHARSRGPGRRRRRARAGSARRSRGRS